MQLRYLLLASITLVVGYLLGTIFGYRTAVVDYVENDAETIEEIADTMYDDDDAIELYGEDVQEFINEANSEQDDTTAFQ